MQDLLARLGNPQQHFQSVVVAGSVGKGTTAQRLASRLMNVGLFTSPHLHSFRERFRIGGTMIAPDVFADLAERVQAQWRPGEIFSMFEQATAIACLWFAEQQVSLAVTEIGLGGRYDAVNALPHELAIITPIELEHAAMLGGTLESIAWHKAGVIPSGGLALTVPQPDAVMRILRAEADSVHAELHIAEFDELADAALDLLRGRVTVSEREIANLAPPMPGRLEVVPLGLDRHLIIDGSHTPLGATRLRALVDTLHQRDVDVMIGMLRDKQAAAYLSEVDKPGWHWTLATLPAARALTAVQLAEVYSPIHATVRQTDDLGLAFSDLRARGSCLSVICGSFRLAALAREFFGLIDVTMVEEARRTRILFEGDSYLRKLG